MKSKFVYILSLISFLFKHYFKIMKNDIVRISHETQSTRDRIKDNKEKIKVNKTLPYLVSNVIEVKKFNLSKIFLFYFIKLVI